MGDSLPVYGEKVRFVELPTLPACPRPAASWKCVRGVKPARGDKPYPVIIEFSH